MLHVYYGSTRGGGGDAGDPSCVISVGQRAAGGRDVLRKQSHVTSCTAAGGLWLLEDLSFIVSEPHGAAEGAVYLGQAARWRVGVSAGRLSELTVCTAAQGKHCCHEIVGWHLKKV